jgi:nucleoside-diphosphate-sugar epimerase
MVGESINLFPKHNFGLCKLFFENLLQREHSNSIIFRLSSVFGNGESLHPNAIEMMSREAINEKLITVWGKGKRKMQYVYIEDVIKYLVTSPKLAPGVYNLCGDDYQTIDETAKKIASYFNVDIKYLNKKEGETIPKLNNQKLVTSINGDLLSNIDSSLESFLSNIK